MADSEVYGFGRETAIRIMREIAPVVGPADMALATRRAAGSSLFVGKVTTAVTARSGTTIGSGVVTLQTINSSGVLSDSSKTEVVKSLYPESISTGRYVLIEKEHDSGLYFVILDPGMFLTNLRLNGNDLQYYKNGTWVTWHTGESCTV